MAKEKIERRFKILFIDQQLILNFVRGMKKFDILRLPVFDNMPEDLQVLSVDYHTERLAFGFLVYSSSFAIIKTNQTIPELACNTVKYAVWLLKPTED